MESYLITICDDIKNEAPQEISTIRFHRTWCLSTALAELQAKPAVEKPRRPIGFIQPKAEEIP